MLEEIAAHTDIADLIRLSRTCKFLYRFFTSPQSRYIWEAKLAGFHIENLPACPVSISVYAYANLVSLSDCQGCNNTPDQIVAVDWDLRVRLCERCLPAIITTFDEAEPPVCLADFPSVKIRDLVPVTPPTPRGCTFVTEELHTIRAKLDSMDAADRAAFISQRKAMMADARAHARQCRAWNFKRYYIVLLEQAQGCSHSLGSSSTGRDVVLLLRLTLDADFDFHTVTTAALRQNYPADNWLVGYQKGNRTGGEHLLAISGRAI
ncbi:hypothetical protein C8R45DRAFT_1131781 [Mycena sanguinolenta]|nr:hypothetical protein C8R45DRAFT_1131781 [Mycena sanguinolenta]